MKNNLLLIILLLLFNSCINSQNNEIPKDISFEDFLEELEDPSLIQQRKAIVKNKIKKCQIEKWKLSPDNDTLELKPEKIQIFFNNLGKVDSLVTGKYEKRKLINYYDSTGKILSRKVVIQNEWGFTIEGISNEPKITRNSFEYNDDNRIVREIIEMTEDSSKYVINFEWEKDKINKITTSNNKDDKLIQYELKYLENSLNQRIITSNSKEEMKPDRKNEFKYDNGNLSEITNTWIIPLESMNKDSTNTIMQGVINDSSEIYSTKFEYYPDGKIKTIKKVYGMWPRESYWITTFYYYENGLIRIKEQNNDSEMGHTKIQFKYTYK